MLFATKLFQKFNFKNFFKNLLVHSKNYVFEYQWQKKETFFIINSDLNLENVFSSKTSKDKKKKSFSESWIFLQNLLYIFAPDFILLIFSEQETYFVSGIHCDSVYATFIFSPMHLICLFIIDKYINLPVITYFAPLLKKYTYLPYKWIDY